MTCLIGACIHHSARGAMRRVAHNNSPRDSSQKNGATAQTIAAPMNFSTHGV